MSMRDRKCCENLDIRPQAPKLPRAGLPGRGGAEKGWGRGGRGGRGGRSHPFREAVFSRLTNPPMTLAPKTVFL